MDRHLVYHISESEDGMKIQDYLRSIIGCSHHVLTHLKHTERGIVRNGEWAYASQRLQTGDILELHVIEEASSEQILPTPIPLDIVYEDDDLMVINKAPDMPIHPSINNHDNTLANGVMYYFQQQNQPFVYRCINRLDRDTSGLLIIAKNLFSGALLYQMSARREIKRQYLAIVEGCAPECGTVNTPIARKPDSAIMRCVDYEHGETAVTHYKRLACWTENSAFDSPSALHDTLSVCSELPEKISEHPRLSLLQIRLETGRTHQIRVHLTSLGYPLAGDFLYNPDSRSAIGRQALHSCSLDFMHPVTKEPMHFASELPDDMKRLFPPDVDSIII